MDSPIRSNNCGKSSWVYLTQTFPTEVHQGDSELWVDCNVTAKPVFWMTLYWIMCSIPSASVWCTYSRAFDSTEPELKTPMFCSNYRCSEEMLLNFSAKEQQKIQETPFMSSGVVVCIWLAGNQLMTPVLPWQVVAAFQLFLMVRLMPNTVFMLQKQTIKWSLSVLFSTPCVDAPHLQCSMYCNYIWPFRWKQQIFWQNFSFFETHVELVTKKKKYFWYSKGMY